MKRCPWCGKKIDCRYDSRRVKQNKLPRFFLFARCSNCDKYYGQAVVTSVYMKIMFIAGGADFNNLSSFVNTLGLFDSDKKNERKRGACYQ